MNTKKMFNAAESELILKQFKAGIAPSVIKKNFKVGKNRIDRFIKENNLQYDPKKYQSGKGRLHVNTLEKVFCKNSVRGNVIVNSLIKEHNIIPHNVCHNCGIEEWLGKEIVFDLDHINGNNRDNSISNLRYLCPNCHSQTLNYKGRNLNSGKTKVSEEKILEAVKLYPNNIRKVLLHVGLTPKGGNYDRIYRIKLKYKIS